MDGFIKKNPEHEGKSELRGAATVGYYPSQLTKEIENDAVDNEDVTKETWNGEYDQDEWESDIEAAEELQPSSSRLSLRSSSSLDNAQPRKYPFKLNHTETGNILTVHHTVEEAAQLLRIRIAACCFNGQSNQLIVIDKRGNIFVFDFVSKRYWRLNFQLPKATLVRHSLLYSSEYVVGNKQGQLFTIDAETSVLVNKSEVGNAAIKALSFSSRASNALVTFGHDAVLLNLKSLKVSHELQFEQARFNLKWAGYLPNSDQFFTCFTNDALHIWSSLTLNTLKIAQPIKSRNRKLRLLPKGCTVPEIALRQSDTSDLEDELTFNCRDQDYADGYLLSYCFTPDGNKFGLSTIDGYLLVLSTATLDLDKLYRLRDFILKQLSFLRHPKERILFGLTARGQVIMLDLANLDYKLIVQRSNASSFCLSNDGKLLAVLSKCGEVNVWSTCRLFNQLHGQTVLRSNLKQPPDALPKLKQPLPACQPVSNCLQSQLRDLLKRDRLQAMLLEFGCYPVKYRFVIWSSLLELPCNGSQFQELLKLGIPPIVENKARSLKITSASLHRGVVKVWSCLAHWCKVFAYVDFMPHFIYPFVKQLPKNGLVAFELLVTLLLNHCQLWFEFHPLPPANYLAMIDNLLQRQDEQLAKFFQAQNVMPKDYAWALLTNAFAEVLDEQQWLQLWDNVITEPPYFLIFLVVAYNVMNREVLLRLPDQSALVAFFHEQNPIDVAKLLRRTRKLINKCEVKLHPKRFMRKFEALPKGVYPKFLSYPNEWIEQQEVQSVALLKQHQLIDARIRHLELEEVKVMERLQDGLKQEEHTRRIKDMEKLYQDTMQREEERITCQRKMLLLYQKEVRQRKSEVMSKVQETEQRRRALEMEREIDVLMHSIERERRRHNQQMLLAEDEIRNQELELMAQRYYAESAGAPLAQKYYDNIQRLCRQRDELQHSLREMTLEQLQPTTQSTSSQQWPQLLDIERSILEIQREFSQIITSDSNGQKADSNC